jgi:DNA-binding transcriptional LysR family regulator
MELRQLQCFVITAEELHFRRAAEIVHIAQPALSHQIKQLEEELGVQLFERDKRHVALTPAGRAFYRRARVLLDSSCQAIQEARSINRGEVGSIAIGFISTAVLEIIPDALRFFHEAYPKIVVELREEGPGEQMDDLKRGLIDIGFTIARIVDEGFRVVELKTIDLMIALPESHRLAAQEEVAFADFTGETLLIPVQHARFGYYEIVMEAYRAAGEKPKNIQCVRMLQTSELLVRSGLGIALMPASFSQVSVSGVVYRKLAPPRPQISVCAVWNENNSSLVLQNFCNQFIATRALIDSKELHVK